MNGSGGDNRVYGAGNNGIAYDIGRNTFRYPNAWKADVRLGKLIELGKMRQLELLGETFNLFNHRNVTDIETIGYSVTPGGAEWLVPHAHLFHRPEDKLHGIRTAAEQQLFLLLSRTPISARPPLALLKSCEYPSMRAAYNCGVREL
jgi:hypothetical protein